MINEYRYILEKGSKKHHCPACNKKTFVRYIDTEKGGYLPEQYGRCDRESKCLHHLDPYLNGYAKEIPNDWKPLQKAIKPQPTPEPVFIPDEILKQTLQPDRYKQNTFIQNLFCRVAFPFSVTDIEKVISLYYLGTVATGYRAGAVTFPFIDIQGKIRAVQVKQFDKTNHTTGTDFLHSIIEKHLTKNNKPFPGWLEAYTKQDKRVSCLFGEHLLNRHPISPVALVEAPKTAIYGALYFGTPEQPENFLWLAVYNLSSLSFEKCQALKGRDVYLFPDLSKNGKAFKLWSNKATEFEARMPGTRFFISDLLEQLAPETDRQKGNDLADYLIKQDWRLFRKKPPKPKLEPVQVEVEIESCEKCEKCEAPKQTFLSHHTPKTEIIPTSFIDENWSNEIAELETYFSEIILPIQPMQLNTYSTITDVPLFIDSHFATVKANNGNYTFLPHLNRLQELKEVCKTI